MAQLGHMLCIDHYAPATIKQDREDKRQEAAQKEAASYWLYVITPAGVEMETIASLVDDSNQHAARTLFCYVEEGGRKFTDFEQQSLRALGKMVRSNGAMWLESLQAAANFLNKGGKDGE